MNAIGVVAPYKYEGIWVFDDPAVGLVREAFVAGIDTMIDRLVASIPDAEQGFRLIFSATPFDASPHLAAVLHTWLPSPPSITIVQTEVLLRRADGHEGLIAARVGHRCPSRRQKICR